MSQDDNKVETLIAALDEKLSDFSDSSKYQMLSGVHIAQFFNDPSVVPDKLKAKTIEEIVLAGARALYDEGDVSDEHLVEMESIVARFIPEEDPESFDHTSSNPMQQEKYDEANRDKKKHSIFPGQFSTDEYPLLSSVQAEQALDESYSKLRANAHYASLASKKLQDFWDTSICRAPFIEALEFSELLEISVGNLLRKRSFGNLKVHGIVAAINNAILMQENRSLEDGSVRKAQNQTVSSIVAPPVWEKLPSSYSSLLTTFIDELEDERQKVYNEQQRITNIFCRLIDSLTQEEFLSLWFEGEQKSASFCDLAGIKKKEGAKILKAASLKVSKLLNEEFSEVYGWFQMVLESPAVHESVLITPFFSPKFDNSKCVGMIRMICVSLGAVSLESHKPEELEGVSLEECWSLNNDRLLEIVRHISLESSAKKRKKLLSHLLPNVNSDKMVKLIEKLAKKTS